MFRVTDLGVTDPFLEEAIFECMRNQKMKRKLREATLMNWLNRAEEADCVDTTFDNLGKQGLHTSWSFCPGSSEVSLSYFRGTTHTKHP